MSYLRFLLRHKFVAWSKALAKIFLIIFGAVFGHFITKSFSFYGTETVTKEMDIHI